MTLPLSDRSVLLSLQELTEDLSTAQDYTPADVDEARALLAALLTATGRSPAAIPEIPDERAARRVLTELSTDPDTSAQATVILSDPPADEQLGVEAAVPSVVVIAAVVTWLQTKITIRVRRRDSSWEFDFHLHKQPAPTSVLHRLASTVTRLLGSPTDPPS